MSSIFPSVRYFTKFKTKLDNSRDRYEIIVSMLREFSLFPLSLSLFFHHNWNNWYCPFNLSAHQFWTISLLLYSVPCICGINTCMMHSFRVINTSIAVYDTFRRYSLYFYHASFSFHLPLFLLSRRPCCFIFINPPLQGKINLPICPCTRSSIARFSQRDQPAIALFTRAFLIFFHERYRRWRKPLLWISAVIFILSNPPSHLSPNHVLPRKALISWISDHIHSRGSISVVGHVCVLARAWLSFSTAGPLHRHVFRRRRFIKPHSWPVFHCSPLDRAPRDFPSPFLPRCNGMAHVQLACVRAGNLRTDRASWNKMSKKFAPDSAR